MDPIQNFSTRNNPKFAADQGGGTGGGSLPGFDLSGLVREELVSNLDERKAAQFPNEREIGKAIRLLVPQTMVANSDVLRISDLLHGAMKAVRSNAKGCGDPLPSASKALSTACRAVESGLIDATEIEDEPNASTLDKLKHLCEYDTSILSLIATSAPRAAVSAPVIASEIAQAAQPVEQQAQTQEETFALSTKVDRLALLASPDPATQAQTSARITALIEANKVTEGQLDEFAFFASGTGKVNQDGTLIVNKDTPLYTSLNTILSLLEDNVEPQMVMLTIQLKRLLETTNIELPDLIDEEKLQSMSEQEFARYLVRKLNLSFETVEAFCNEFQLDLDEMVGSDEGTFNFTAANETLEELAEGIIFAMQNCEGKSIDARVRALIEVSKEHPSLRGNLERVRNLFED